MPSKSSVKATESTETKPLIRKCFSPGEAWSKDEFLDGIYWTRQACSLVSGVGVGLAGYTGFAVITTFITLNFLLSLMYFRSFLGVDIEDFGGQTEGLVPSIGLFVLCWTLFYSAFH
uniref:ER membrane protein complex subunit 6 n=1 Tax=Rhodosorus marinus TaxID=101924 RepID=A0A7S3EFI3_9RHOD|mmetsp:Transcript_30219/g.115893  ORF Transcript_30219/g.115893 Transcript_30219/m.115893 type:complete len:117 (+) Transcript_30219:282-632(+)|eukprot:CAMPEP_0113964714 /NCGR_PEP_ID=MMETSP0011_2-20120614/7310_1 /TAXON_ID=101924 /ORGANISM="Rhodosorus marinus" /LENGTH=116 /DNA_ID=CAMNT_0000977081 /DNA_START=136 /DNA_END=486 /DNA_ORIENTATION=- /assembly_acc=CAM_ASM_000156